jgi:hypothetical protein
MKVVGGNRFGKVGGRMDLSPEQRSRFRRELRKGLEQLDRGQYADFDAATIIADERRRMMKESQ